MQNRLYRDVQALQGVRNAVTNYDGLVRGTDYIRRSLAEANVAVESQEFYVDGFPLPFENLIARIGTPGKPLVVLGAHYDSVAVSPGAADNASGAALLLEAARHFAPLADQVNLALVFFTLEERNPAIDQVEYLVGTQLGVMDKNWNYTTPEYTAAKRNFFNRVASRKDLPYSESFRLALENTELPPPMDELFRQMYQVVKDFRKEGGFGDCYVVGSDRWVAANRQLLSELEIALIFDEVAAAWDEPDTQFIMLPETLMSYAETFGTDLDNRVGNFIAVAAGCGGAAYLDRFRQSARGESLPYVTLDLPLSYPEFLRCGFPVLNSDHAPFWREDMPALLITDMGHAGRDKFVHTPADTIEHINFSFMEKVTRAAIGSIEQLYGI